MLKQGESKTVEFEISTDDLAFYRQDMSYGVEAGFFDVYIGTSSQQNRQAEFSISEETQSPH